MFKNTFNLKKILIFSLIIIILSCVIAFKNQIYYTYKEFDRASYNGKYIIIKDNPVKTYHRDNCTVLNLFTKNRFEIFDSPVETVLKGYSPCPQCTPRNITYEESVKIADIQQEKSRVFENLVSKRFEERKNQILSGEKTNLTKEEKLYKEYCNTRYAEMYGTSLWYQIRYEVQAEEDMKEATKELEEKAK